PMTEVPPQGHTDLLAQYADQVAEILTRSSDINQKLDCIASQLKTNLLSVNFIDSVLGVVISKIEEGCIDATTIFRSKTNNFRVRTLWWPPGFSTPVHPHHEWGVTGVILNVLSFCIYSGLRSNQPRPSITRHIIAREGEVGKFVPPCVHSVTNPSLH